MSPEAPILDGNSGDPSCLVTPALGTIQPPIAEWRRQQNVGIIHQSKCTVLGIGTVCTSHVYHFRRMKELFSHVFSAVTWDTRNNYRVHRANILLNRAVTESEPWRQDDAERNENRQLRQMTIKQWQRAMSSLVNYVCLANSLRHAKN